MHHEMSCHNAVIFFTIKTIAEAACRKEEMLFEFLPLFLLLSYEFRIVQNFPRNISIEYDKGYAFFSCIEIMQYA